MKETKGGAAVERRGLHLVREVPTTPSVCDDRLRVNPIRAWTPACALALSLRRHRLDLAAPGSGCDERPSLFAWPALVLAVLGVLGPFIAPGMLIAAGRWDSALDRTVMLLNRRAFDPRTLP